MKQFLAGIVVMLITTQLHAQQFGAFPPSVKWQQINTNTVRIIYPAVVDSQAQQIADIIQKIIIRQPNSLGTHVRKIDIVLHNATTLANGYVALAPFRSEYYLIPGSDIFEFGANPWYQELAVHEYRHVLQYSNFNRGISKIGSIIFGESGQALFNALVIPGWFWEGDAVHAETALTPQGRGRTPYFFNGYKSLWREGREYNWMKLRNGSLKDYVPDHYNLGYLLVNYGYLKYGDDFWKKVSNDAAAYKGLFYPLQKAVKRYSGVDYKTFRKEALDYYSARVKENTVKQKRQTVTNYYFPQYINDDSLLYVKSSYKKLPAFYIKDKNGEHKLRLKNLSTEDWLSYRKGTIAYTAYETNARWSLVNYSSIYLYDIHSNRQKKITNKARYFTPDISPSGKKIIAVSVNEKTETALHVLDASGKILKLLPAIDHSYFTHPRFIDENTIVVMERLRNSTMQMSRMDLLTGSREILIPSTSALLGYPFPYQGSIYFVSSVKGVDDIYALRLSDKKIFRAQSGVTGKYYPSVYKDSLAWSAFTSNGLQLNEKTLTLDETNEIDPQSWNEVVLPYPVADADGPSNLLVKSSRRFPVSRYKQGAHLFNFHSWNPEYTDPELTLTLLSNNVLNTFSNEVYYRYNQNETSHAFGFNSSYGKWFPVINAGVEYILNRTFFDTVRRYDVNQIEARIGYNIPLSFTAKRMYRFLDFGSDYVFNQTSFVGKKDSGQTQFSYLHHFISWSHYLPRARQHIYPKFGYTLSADLRHVIDSHFGGTFSQNAQWLLGAQLFLPSFGNHSIVLSAAYQRVDTVSAVFSNRFSNSRGYEDYYFRKMWRASANYHFPILYPDFGVANIVYLQRVRGNVFYDYTKVYSGYFAEDPYPLRTLRSTGLEIYFDTKFWNELPVSFGIRASYLLDDGFSSQDRKGNTWVELILPLDLIPN
jgi:hypothetical protein